MRRISADSVLLAVLAACAITTTGLIVRRTFVDEHPTTLQDSMIPDWKTITRDGESEGSPTSAATLIVFSEPVNGFETLGGQNLESIPSVELTSSAGLIGLSIHAAVGSAGGVGACLTKRSGWAA